MGDKGGDEAGDKSCKKVDAAPSTIIINIIIIMIMIII